MLASPTTSYAFLGKVIQPLLPKSSRLFSEENDNFLKLDVMGKEYK